MTKKSLDDYRVEDFVADESFINYYFQINDKDSLFWEEWLMKNPSKRFLAKEACEIIGTFSLTLNDSEYHEEFGKIKFAINNNKPGHVFDFLNWNRTSQVIRHRRTLMYSILGFLILASGIYFLFNQHKENNRFNENQIVSSGNKTLTFMLSDSTVVTLFPNSRLQYPSIFQGRNRQVYLHGDAAFNVKRNEHFPFKVHTENLVTTVLGTIFNIKKSGDSALIVELLKGKLNVEIEDFKIASALPILLYPEQKAIFIFHNNHFYKNDDHAEQSISFHHNSFEQIAFRMKEVFGKTLINQSNKRNWSFTADFKNTNAKEIIQNICLVKNLKSKEVEDTVFINN